MLDFSGIRLHAGQVRGGLVEMDAQFPEGTRITEITGEMEERYGQHGSEKELLLALKEAEQGGVVPAARLLKPLRQL